MRGSKILRFVKIALIVAAAVLVFGFAVAHLWNYVVPSLFGLHSITFRQAIALVILGRLLFGGFRPGRGGMHWRGRMMERWEKMTPEQREKFREGMRGRCGTFRDPTPEPKA